MAYSARLTTDYASYGLILSDATNLADPQRLRLNRLGGMPAGILSLCIYGPLNWLRSLDNGSPAEGRRVDF